MWKKIFIEGIETNYEASKDGIIIDTFPSIRQAALAVNGTPSAISRVLSGT